MADLWPHLVFTAFGLLASEVIIPGSEYLLDYARVLRSETIAPGPRLPINLIMKPLDARLRGRLWYVENESTEYVNVTIGDLKPSARVSESEFFDLRDRVVVKMPRGRRLRRPVNKLRFPEGKAPAAKLKVLDYIDQWKIFRRTQFEQGLHVWHPDEERHANKLTWSALSALYLLYFSNDVNGDLADQSKRLGSAALQLPPAAR